MNGAHFHLIVNHISIFALLFGVLILAAGFKWPSREMLFTALSLFVLAGVFAWITDKSGHGAAEDLRAFVPGVEMPIIKEHAQAANFAVISGSITAVLALLVGWMALKKPARLKTARIALLIVALWAFSVFVRVVYLGGLIRHVEIRG